MPTKQFLDHFAFICQITLVLLIAFGLSTTADASRLASGAGFTVVVKSDSTVLAWGTNRYLGQVGDGTNADRLSPVHVVDALGDPITGIQAVASGRNHTTAIKLDGTLMTWGYAWPYAVPVVDESGNSITGVEAVAASEGQTLALKSDGTLWTWGNRGQSYPEQVVYESGDPVSDIQAIAAGAGHYLALQSDGSLLAWGINTYGQLGDGTTTFRTNPVAGKDENGNLITGIQGIAAGVYHTVALKTNGNLLAWGYNAYGQLGDGTIVDHYYPAPVVDESGNPITGIRNMEGGGYHTLALKPDGTLLAWGWNARGQLGDGTVRDRYNPVAVVDDQGDPVSCIQTVSAGTTSSVVLKMDGTVLTWGDNSLGQLGDGTKSNRMTPVPVLETPLMDIRAVEAGHSFTFALNLAGNLLAWGSNLYGQLGNGTTNKRYIPGLVVNEDGDPIEGIQSVSAGNNHVLALTAAGTILGWGKNIDGQIGDGTNEYRYNPVQVVDELGNPVSDIQSVSAGSGFSLALKTDGSLLAWGENDYGQLGNGTIVNQSNPVLVIDALGNQITDIQAVSAGSSHTLALKTDGTLLAWGSNNNGQLGDGTAGDPDDGIYVPRSNPVAVVDESGNPITGVQAVYAGGQFSVALRTDGTLLAWGRNAWGKLGDGTTENRHNPVPVLAGPGTPLTGIQAVAVGSDHVLALQSDTGGMLAWGNNYYGQLGNNETLTGYNPVPVAVVRAPNGDPATGFRAMSAGGVHSVALLNDSVLATEGVAAWGENNNWQVGDFSSTVDYARPLLLITRSSWLPVLGAGIENYHFLNIGGSGEGVGTVQFTSGFESIVEDEGSIFLTVSRTCGSNGAASVEYVTSNSTAVAGEDYTGQSGTLSWPDGDAATQQISIPVTADSSDEDDETFMVTLNNIAGTSMGSPDTVTVTIINKTYADTDGDGVTDNLDAFPDDPAASLDTDNDGDPDDWNPGRSEADSILGLTLDLDDDNDGIPDDWETQYGLNPLVDDAGGDSDGDGIKNLDEFLNGSSPLLKSGDVNFDGEISVPDAILSLKVLTSDHSQLIPEDADINADVNMDKVIGIEEVIFILKGASQ